MAKQLGKFEIVIRGTEAEGPQEAFVRYFVEDSADTSMRSPLRDTQISSPDFTKKIHDAGTAGEFWKDEVEAAKTAEEIS